MKKTIIINIGNTIIHIEEDAYDILTTYLNEIKQHFAKNADDFEIVTDIENRIAEMFAEILHSNQKQAIDMADVQNVIAQMGSVKDFQSDEEDETPKIDNFTNFANPKKLFRDTDAGIIAGVCSGLGHYLNVESRWIRVIAFLSIFLAGAGVLAYIILWIAMPRARSRSEKMEMKGEATNLYGYQKSFEEELAAFKENMKNASGYMQPIAKRSGNFISQLFQYIGKIISGLGRFVGKIFAWLIIIFGFGLLVSFIVTLGLLLGAWDEGLYNNFPFNVFNVPYRDELVFAAFFSVFIPILALVLFAVKVIFSHIQISKYVSFLLLGIWIIATLITGFNVAKVVSAFNEEAEIAKRIDLKPYKNYVFKVDPGMIFSAEDSIRYKLGNNENGYRIMVDRTSNGVFVDPKNVRLTFEKTEETGVTITQSYRSNGRNFEDALTNAQNLIYNYQIADSVITLTPRATLKKASAWRGQGVELRVKLPIGTQVILHNDLYHYLKFNYYCNHGDERIDTENEIWVMTEEGLRCKYELDHPKEESNP